MYLRLILIHVPIDDQRPPTSQQQLLSGLGTGGQVLILAVLLVALNSWQTPPLSPEAAGPKGRHLCFRAKEI